MIAVKLAPAVYEKIRSFVEKGLYLSPEQFLEIAAFNQVALESGIRPEEIVSRGHRGEVSPGVVPAERPRPRAPVSRGAKRGRATVGKKPAPRAVSPEDLDTVLQRFALPASTDFPPTRSSTLRPATERLWGQVNRLFPLKVACRWIAVENASLDSWETVDSVGERLSADAAMLGSTLEQNDSASGRKRDELLSTGLPRRGNAASIERFMSQFVARVTRSSEIYPGAITQYGLADFDGDRVALTSEGLALAMLRNPILDEDLTKAAATLSDEERRFFALQVLQFVPGELREMRFVLKAILEGTTTPESVLAAVRPLLAQEWSDVMARTHVSGVVARLAEIGLIRRRWQGRHVSYEASGMASTLLERERG
jgi:hypothetical protein